MNELINMSNELVHKMRVYEDYRPGTVLIGLNDALIDGYYLLFDNYNIYRDPMHSVNYDNKITYYSLTRNTGFEFSVNSKNNIIMLNSNNIACDLAWYNLTSNSNISYYFDISRFKSYFMSNLKSIFGVFDHSLNNFIPANDKMYTKFSDPALQIWSNDTYVGFYSTQDEYYSVCNLDTLQRTMYLDTSVSKYEGYIYENISTEPIFKKLYVKSTHDSEGNKLNFIIKSVDRLINTISEIYSTEILIDSDETQHYYQDYGNISNIFEVGANRYLVIPKYVEDNIGLKIGITMFLIEDTAITNVGDYFNDKYDLYFEDNQILDSGVDLISKFKTYTKVNYDVDSNTHTIIMINSCSVSLECALYKSFKLESNSIVPSEYNITYNSGNFSNTNPIDIVHLASNDANYIVLKYSDSIYAGIWNKYISEYIFSNIAYGTDFIADFNDRKFIISNRDSIYVSYMYSNEYEIYVKFADELYKYLGEDIKSSISIACIAVDKLISKKLYLTIEGDCVFTSNGEQTLQISTDSTSKIDVDITITGPSLVQIHSEIM